MKDNKWSRDEMVFLYDSRMQRKPYRLIAVELGRTEKSCECKFRETDWVKEGIATLAVEQSAYEKISQFTQQQVNYLDKRLNVFRMRADLIADAIERSVEALPKVPPAVYKPTQKQKKHNPQDVGVMLSDFHVGQQHTLEETGGLSEYNIDIFLRRLDNLKRGIIEITERHQSDTIIENLHLFCLGDFVAGLNAAGGWSYLYIDSPMYKQMVTAADALTNLIYHLTPLYKSINVYGIAGNHGRSAKVGEQKDIDNWDNVVYKLTQTALRNNERVKFKIPESWWSMEQIRNHRFLLVHGDYTRGGAMKGLENFGNRMIGIIGKFDYLLAGHFHNTAELTTNCFKIKVNGSLVGSDVYSLRNVHAFSKPEQKIFGIHDKQGVTWTYDLNLDVSRG
jgi:hypothetical protein